MAAHGEKSWPSVGNFSGRPWGGSHGRRQRTMESARSTSLTPDARCLCCDGSGTRQLRCRGRAIVMARAIQTSAIPFQATARPEATAGTRPKTALLNRYRRDIASDTDSKSTVDPWVGPVVLAGRADEPTPRCRCQWHSDTGSSFLPDECPWSQQTISVLSPRPGVALSRPHSSSHPTKWSSSERCHEHEQQ